MATHSDKLRIAEIPTDVEVDPVTLDIIEGALKNARFEMDAVLFRSAMSPVIREQHDEFPMITDPRGRMVVGQFGAYINEMMADWDRGDLPGRRDPHVRSVQVLGVDLAHERLARAACRSSSRTSWSAGRASSATRWTRGGPLPGSLPTGATTIFEEGIIIPPIKIIERGVRAGGRARADPQQRPPPGDEPRRPVRDRRRLPRRRARVHRPVRAVRQGHLPRRAAGAARPHLRGDARR